MNTASPLLQCGRLLAIALAAAIVLSPIAMLVAGVPGLQGLAVSAGLCLLPGLVTVWLASSVKDPMVKVWLTVGGMLVRMFVVLMAALVFYTLRPEWGMAEFYTWLIVFYNVLLFAETWLLLPRGNSAA
jgi:hypothetical protein